MLRFLWCFEPNCRRGEKRPLSCGKVDFAGLRGPVAGGLIPWVGPVPTAKRRVSGWKRAFKKDRKKAKKLFGEVFAGGFPA